MPTHALSSLALSTALLAGPAFSAAAAPQIPDDAPPLGRVTKTTVTVAPDAFTFRVVPSVTPDTVNVTSTIFGKQMTEPMPCETVKSVANGLAGSSRAHRDFADKYLTPIVSFGLDNSEGGLEVSAENGPITSEQARESFVRIATTDLKIAMSKAMNEAQKYCPK